MSNFTITIEIPALDRWIAALANMHPGTPAPVAAPVTAAAPPSPAPVATPAAIPTAEPDYTPAQLGRAAAAYIDKAPGNMGQLTALLQQFGVQAITHLQTPAARTAFANALRELGAQV